jgi:hypothetical protein
MRTLFFSFKFSNVNSGKNIANALLHYAFPRRHHLLFAYDFRYIYLNRFDFKNVKPNIIFSENHIYKAAGMMFPCSTIKVIGKPSLQIQSVQAGEYHPAMNATTHPQSTKNLIPNQ